MDGAFGEQHGVFLLWRGLEMNKKCYFFHSHRNFPLGFSSIQLQLTLSYPLTPYTKINSKCLRDLNIKHDTTELLEANTGKTFSDTDCTNVSIFS